VWLLMALLPPTRRRCPVQVIATPGPPLLALLMLLCAAERQAVEARQTPEQRAIVSSLTAEAVAASAGATRYLLAELDSPALRAGLTQRGLRDLAKAPARVLLSRLRAEISAAELVHNLAILTNGSGGDICGSACLGWSPGNCDGMPRTPISSNCSELNNLWALGTTGWVAPDTVRGWMGGPDTFEVGCVGCPPFTGTLPYHCGTGHCSRDWPATLAEAQQRPIYAVVDLKKIDAGIPDFGPVGLVFNKSTLASATILMPADTGEWSGTCNMTNRGQHCSAAPPHALSRSQCESDPEHRCRWVAAQEVNQTGRCVSASDRCCVTLGRHASAAISGGCDTCAANQACCQAGALPAYNCSAWDVTPGVAGHVDHILLAASRMWNDTAYNPARNLADLLGRAASDYFGDTPPLLQPHNNYYIEANILATPEYSAGASDVLFAIGTFPFLFGHPQGTRVRVWAAAHRWPLVWALGAWIQTEFSLPRNVRRVLPLI
jgi:hypothetical protein